MSEATGELMDERIKVTNEMIQPQSSNAMYPTIHINLDTTGEWTKLFGDRSDKHDEMRIINTKIMNEVKAQILKEHQEYPSLVEKAEKYDALGNIIAQVNMLLLENKGLKEERNEDEQQINDYGQEICDQHVEIQNLKEKVEELLGDKA